MQFCFFVVFFFLPYTMQITDHISFHGTHTTVGRLGNIKLMSTYLFFFLFFQIPGVYLMLCTLFTHICAEGTDRTIHFFRDFAMSLKNVITFLIRIPDENRKLRH